MGKKYCCIAIATLMCAVGCRSVAPMSPARAAFEKAELVVIASAEASLTNGASRAFSYTDSRGDGYETETTFAAHLVLKGCSELDRFVLLHYTRVLDDKYRNRMFGLPFDMRFEVPEVDASFGAGGGFLEGGLPPPSQKYLLFLVRRPDGKYAPVAGQELLRESVFMISPAGWNSLLGEAE